MRTLVYLIGTGPGDPGLLTVRGQRCLEAADVVIYDRAVHPRVLGLAPSHAERIDVGRPARESDDQDAISMLLAEKAREGKVVARLKRGDSFVFDRGGEEALFLHENGIPFEVVPGVPSAIGITAYAGIPLTYTGAGDTLTFVRGHGAGERSKANWTHLAASSGAIVCYGLREDLARVVRELLDNGRPADDPAALIAHGTLPGQQTVVGTLAEFEDHVAALASDSLAALVVGKVVGLRDHVRWFDQRPLFGRRVLVTRSRHQSAELVDLLEAAGAEAVEAPVLRVAPVEDFQALDGATDALTEFDWVVFVTVNAVDGFMHRLFERGRDARALNGPTLVAAGVGTAERLARFGIRVDVATEGQSVGAIVEKLQVRAPLAGRRVLIPAALGSRDPLTEALGAAGAHVTMAAAFQTLAVEDNPELDVYGQLLQRRIDVVTFTSAAAVRSFATLYGEDQVADLLAHTTVAAVGPAATDAVRRLGVTPAITPPVASLASLVDAIRAHFQ